MTMSIPPDYVAPHRLILSRSALRANYRWLAAQAPGAACGAAVKADGYGLGAAEVVQILLAEGCRDFFVATWAEAAAIADLVPQNSIAVLHGVRAEDMGVARMLAPVARPVLNSAEQIARWRAAGGGACDVMVDTGINRLGLPMADLALLDGLEITTCHSHLASADTDVAQNTQQLARFQQVHTLVQAERYSLANSAGICLGRDYHFDLVRPGLALYGGVPRAEAAAHIAQVAFPEAQILQIRTVAPGEGVGYNATWLAHAPSRVATINLGYADGYLRGFSGQGRAYAVDGTILPVIGRVSMDLVTLALADDSPLCEGDWLRIDFDLSRAAEQSGLSPYELLTGVGGRYQRYWID